MIRPALVALVITGFVAGGSAAPSDIPADVLEAYLKIHASLAGDTMDGVQAAAASLVKAGQALGPAGTTLASAAQKVAGAADLKAARAGFGELSDALVAWAGSGTGGKDVRLAYCPMVKKHWLQKGNEIANPYYGSQMLRCGEFKK
ncbi:MAG: metal transporter [Acidobacteriota bacterium]